jgi:LuxR family maltose regulon positive regulatory protein
LPRDRRSSDDPAFIHLLLATFESALQRAVQTTAEPSAVATDPELVEILSAREIEIVALLSERMRDKEIAARLSISPETVKSHLRNIYGKLEAHDRRQAVSRAIEVGILKPPG